MAAFKFTLDSVVGATCPPGRKDALFFDTIVRGFGLRVSPNGGKSFLAQYTTPAGKRRVALGSFGTLTIDKARQHARVILSEAAAGRDPVAEKREKAAAAVASKKAAAFTFGRLVDDWIEAREGERRPSYLREAKACLVRNLPGWLDRPAAGITTTDALDALDAIRKGKSVVAANRTLAYARAAFGHAVRRQRLTTNPLRGIERPGREVARERVLGEAELGAIWRACDALSGAQAGFVRVLLLTLGRRDEVASMRWTELDSLDRPTTWTLPAARAKNGRTHVVHLPELARQAIAAQPRIEGNPFVFTGREGGHISGFSRIKDLLVSALAKESKDLGDWRLHDFRRAGVTHLAGRGVAIHVSDRLLNHLTGSISGVAAIYQQNEFAAERKAALDTWARLILAAADGREVEGNVVSLARAG